MKRAGHDGEVEALSPADKLFHGSGAEGIGGGKQNGVALGFEEVAEFGGRGGFAGAIDPYDEEDGRLVVGGRAKGEGLGGKEGGDFLTGSLDNIGGRNLATKSFEIVDDFKRKADTKVARDQVGFEVVPIDFRFVRDFVEEVFEKSGHA